ncbi:MAG: DUF5053 domain-containing protein [Rikenellaceae bacterium]
MVTKIDELKRAFVAAKTDSERGLISDQLDALIAEDANAVGCAALESIKAVNQEVESMILRDQLKDILPIVSSAYIAKTYFNKTRCWFTQRINGNIINGKPARFNEEELAILKYALLDISEKLTRSVSVVF